MAELSGYLVDLAEEVGQELVYSLPDYIIGSGEPQ